MILFKRARDASRYLQKQSDAGKEIGFVPTMGAIHEGHLSLAQASKRNNAFTVCSVFINPTQFNNRSDFERYPVTLEKDIDAVAATGCDALFIPTVAEMYPDNYAAPVYNLGYLETVLEGAYRPGHFQGVCQVVHRLLQIVNPDRLYLGQKDYQQCKVIQRLLQTTNRDHHTEIVISPTLREADGLAMSSRNLRLTPEQRAKAPGIYKALTEAKASIVHKSIADVKATAISRLTADGFAVDYFELVSAETLLLPTEPLERVVALTAASLGGVRLIDNLAL